MKQKLRGMDRIFSSKRSKNAEIEKTGQVSPIQALPLSKGRISSVEPKRLDPVGASHKDSNYSCRLSTGSSAG